MYAYKSDEKRKRTSTYVIQKQICLFGYREYPSRSFVLSLSPTSVPHRSSVARKYYKDLFFTHHLKIVLYFNSDTPKPFEYVNLK